MSAAVNPVYTPLLEASIVQPLLRNFGWRFATLNVTLAGGFTPAVSSTFSVIPGTVTGIFAGMPNAFVFSVGSVQFRVDYAIVGGIEHETWRRGPTCWRLDCSAHEAYLKSEQPGAKK